MNLIDIMPALAKPFPVEEVDFLIKTPRYLKEDECLGLPFADPRSYQDRLNAVCPGEWSTPQMITVTVGKKIIITVTVIICGVPHTDVGEASISDNPNEDNSATEAYAQAFKRACSQAGLGRYFYSLGKTILPYNKAAKRINMKPYEKRNRVVEMYQKAGLLPIAPGRQDSAGQPVSTGQIEEIRQLAIAKKRQVKLPRTDQEAERLLKQLRAS